MMTPMKIYEEKKMIKSLCLSAILMSLLTANEQQNITVEAKEISTTLLKTLGTALKKEIKSHGIVAAAKFCNLNAMDLTQQVTKSNNTISVKRIALKYRNPNNAPLADEQPVLEAMQQLSLSHVTLPKSVVQTTPQGYKYYQPLTINKPICLSCHGTLKKGSELDKFFKSHYPEDRATGFRMGDLRGFIVVTFTKAH